MPKGCKLTPRQERFCQEYLIDLNGAQAAIRSGYSPNCGKETACELLTYPHVRARIDKALAERSKRVGVNADRVMRELARIAFVNPPDVINAADATVRDNATLDDTAAIASVKVKVIPSEDGDIIEREVRLNDKIKALELLGKHLGMFADPDKRNLEIQKLQIELDRMKAGEDDSALRELAEAIRTSRKVAAESDGS